MAHVAYDLEGGEFDGECPPSHPVKLPQLKFSMRVVEYPGGEHVFSDQGDAFHASFFSGWQEEKFQNLLDECDSHNFCKDHLTTFRGSMPQGTGAYVHAALEDVQPRTPLAKWQLVGHMHVAAADNHQFLNHEYKT